MATTPPQYIIAIGASAGGIEEIQHFFDHTPLDSVTYVIVQHLSPDFKSRMVELLAKHSKLKVIEAEEGMLVQDNKVYLIPHKKFMTIQHGMLHLTNKNEVVGPHLTINTFFNSLAKERREKAVAVVLSGLGSDGTEGAKAIHEAGGIVIAREPATSEFSSMPASVIATGIVDYILEPELMPAAIEYYVKNDGALLPQASYNKTEEKIIVAIIDLIKDRLPLDFSDYKQTTILRRIKRRAANHNFTKLQSYLAFCKVNNQEVEALAKDFLISVTSFFRDKEAFEFLQKNVITEIIKKAREGEEIKIWVSGCATGQEAYSIAILIREGLTGKVKDYPVKIFATDIDSTALAFAGKGRYPENITKDVSAGRIENFFTKEDDSYVVKQVIRKMLIFAQHDVVKNPPYCNMDLISCRNLLIYMTPVLQKKIYNMLHFGLKKGGYLFLGSSENAQPIGSNVEILSKKWRIYKNILSKKNIYADPFSLPDFSIGKNALSKKPAHNNYIFDNELTESISQDIMKELGYMLICVDENSQIIKTYGDTNKYLIQKNFNINLVDLLPEQLSVAFKVTAQRALHSNDKVALNGIKFKKGNRVISVNLLVKPLSAKVESQKYLLALFTEEPVAGFKQTKDKNYNQTFLLDEYTSNIEEELRELRSELSSANEKLDASNENLQSYNEELLSANEEMQSTNEEMQSVNEELHTINSDYQLKNKELMELNDELNNYFRSNPNGQLYVNNDLLLMKFSPGAVKHINLRDSDIGRPITNISTNIKFETIEKDIKQIIKHGGKLSKEIQAIDGKWYQLMTMPYIHQADNKVHGVIMTFNDITQLKEIQFELDKTNKNLLRINEDLDNFVHTASHDLLGPLGNIVLSISAVNELEIANPKLQSILNIVNSSVKKFSSLIQDMSVIGKIETGMLELEDVNIAEVVNDINLSIQDKIDKSKAVIETDLQVKEIHFSKKNFRSIIYNLISNALKFRSHVHPPVISIASGKKDGQVFISISDNGIGIPKSGMQTIFNVHGKLHQDIEGQGMGLFLIKKIVDAAGGSIAVESKPGKGSRFTIYFKGEKQQSELSAVENTNGLPVKKKTAKNN